MMTTLHDALHVRDAPELRHIGKALFCQNSFAVVKTITFVWCSFVVIRDLFEKPTFQHWSTQNPRKTFEFEIFFLHQQTVTFEFNNNVVSTVLPG